MKIRNLFFAGMLGLVATPMMATAAEDRSTMERAGDYVSDAVLTTRVKAALAGQSELSAIDISVESNDGVVTLSGKVDNEAQVELADEVVSDVDGVKSVHNTLRAK